MSDRLRHLQRQQAILREHLAWIDAEIVRELPATTPSSPPPLVAKSADSENVVASPATPPAAAQPPLLAPSASVATPSPSSTPPALPAADPDALLERYASTERQSPADVRRGCFIVFFAAFFLLTAAFATVWVLFYS